VVFLKYVVIKIELGLEEIDLFFLDEVLQDHFKLLSFEQKPLVHLEKLNKRNTFLRNWI